MSGRPWYKRCGADFIEGTMGLSLEEKGAYSLCLDLIYSNGGPIADDDRWIAGVCGVSVRKWKALRQRLIEAGKLTSIDGRLSNARAEKELVISPKTPRKVVENSAKTAREHAENEAGPNKNNNLEPSIREEEIREEKKEPLRGRDASDDIRKTLFDEGVKVLECRSGMPERKARALLAKWLQSAGDDAAKVMAKIRQAEADRVLDIVAWVTKALQPSPRNWRQEPEYRGVL